MDLCTKNEFKNLKSISPVNQRQSDFSIDHILNRAGENSVRQKKINPHPATSLVPENIKFLPNPPVLAKTMFSWLQHTRYKPPKIERPYRIGPVKRTPGRLPRVPFTPGQLSALEDAYRLSSYLSSEDANHLADKLDLTSMRVKIWFQNRRARERRESKDMDLRDVDNFSQTGFTDNQMRSSEQRTNRINDEA